jgi:hypothetical protein
MVAVKEAGEEVVEEVGEEAGEDPEAHLQYRHCHRRYGRDTRCYGSARTVLADFLSRLLLRTVTCLLTFLYDCEQ